MRSLIWLLKRFKYFFVDDNILSLKKSTPKITKYNIDDKVRFKTGFKGYTIDIQGKIT